MLTWFFQIICHHFFPSVGECEKKKSFCGLKYTGTLCLKHFSLRVCNFLWFGLGWQRAGHTHLRSLLQISWIWLFSLDAQRLQQLSLCYKQVPLKARRRQTNLTAVRLACLCLNKQRRVKWGLEGLKTPQYVLQKRNSNENCQHQRRGNTPPPWPGEKFGGFYPQGKCFIQLIC